MALKPATSDSISFKLATSLPVAIEFWVCDRLLLIDFRVCRATIAPSFVRMLDILTSSGRRFSASQFVLNGSKQHSEACETFFGPRQSGRCKGTLAQRV